MMKKYSFKDDYSEGAHPEILDKLVAVNLQQRKGYGLDDFSLQAKENIKKIINHQDATIHFVSGGTQANLIVIGALLKPYESVIAAQTGHIAVHETGAIEATGHKINTVKTNDGKLTPTAIQKVLDEHTDEHMVKPRMVYISNTTELGTLYSKSELEALRTFCNANDLLLYMDGARLAMALTASTNDLTLTDIAKLTDVFYIGGTKNGALLGEAIVINNKALQNHFRFHLKQRGALLAKGRLIGIQFLVLFENDLFFKAGKHANTQAAYLADGLKELGYSFRYAPVSNQVFPILPNTLIKKLSQDYGFHIWESVNPEESAIRLVCSWATTAVAVKQFIAKIS